MTFISHLREFAAAHAKARDQGLRAAANVVVNRVKRDLRGGYTSGDFVTGASINAVAALGPEWDGLDRVMRVGTILFYNLAWEIGHHNLFTRRFERKEVWVPAFTATAADQARAFAAAYQRTMASLGFRNEGGSIGPDAGESAGESSGATGSTGGTAPGRDAQGRFIRRGAP